MASRNNPHAAISNEAFSMARYMDNNPQRGRFHGSERIARELAAAGVARIIKVGYVSPFVHA